jgi:hypothetical protein
MKQQARTKGQRIKQQIGLWSLVAAFALTGCTTSSTARKWNDRVGPDGKPVYVKSHTTVGLNVGIFIPLLGATTLPKQIDRLTKDIAAENGNVVRMIETSRENYWYGWPPFTWVLTPVITTVTGDYEPSPDVLANDRAKEEKEKAAKKKK